MIKRHKISLIPLAKILNVKYNTIAPSEDELNIHHESRHLNMTI